VNCNFVKHFHFHIGPMLFLQVWIDLVALKLHRVGLWGACSTSIIRRPIVISLYRHFTDIRPTLL
jgi:hypothetical protein